MTIKYFAGFLQGSLLTATWFWWIMLGGDVKNPIFIFPLIFTVVSLIGWGAAIIENWGRE